MGAIRGLISSVARGAGRFDEGSVRPGGHALSFHSKCQTAARVRSFSRRDCVRGLPSTFVTAGLDPVVHADCGSERPYRLVRSSLSSAWIAGSSPAMTTKKKGGEAPKDACRPLSAPFLPWGGGAEAIHRRQACAVCATYRLRGPLAFRRSAAALAPASERQDSAQAALHAKHDAKALPPLKLRLSEAPRAPVVMPAGIDAQDRPGAGLQAPPAGTALAPSTGCHRSTSLT